MPARDKTKIVKLERGRFSTNFQVARACISAASALMGSDPRRAKHYIANAMSELAVLMADLGGA